MLWNIFTAMVKPGLDDFFFMVQNFIPVGCGLTPALATTAEILFPGPLNTLAGPDFSQAKIYLDQLYWDGAVELHMNASDWFRHGQ